MTPDEYKRAQRELDAERGKQQSDRAIIGVVVIVGIALGVALMIKAFSMF